MRLLGQGWLARGAQAGCRITDWFGRWDHRRPSASASGDDRCRRGSRYGPDWRFRGMNGHGHASRARADRCHDCIGRRTGIMSVGASGGSPVHRSRPDAVTDSQRVTDATERLARLAGLALAGLLSRVVSLKHLSTFNGATQADFAAALWIIGRRRPIPRAAQGDASRMIDAMLRDVRVTRRHRFLVWVLATTDLLNSARSSPRRTNSPRNRTKEVRSSSASARRTSDRSCRVAGSSTRNSARGGQPGSPLLDDEMLESNSSCSAQSTSAETSSSDAPMDRAARSPQSCSCPIRRRAIACSNCS